MNWYIDAMKKYSDFSGRARRKEYWFFVLFNIIIGITLGFIGGVTGSSLIQLLSGLYSLAVIVPGIAVSVRRLHDTGRSGWLLLLSLIPLIGALILIVFMVQDSMPLQNSYGPNPKQAG